MSTWPERISDRPPFAPLRVAAMFGRRGVIAAGHEQRMLREARHFAQKVNVGIVPGGRQTRRDEPLALPFVAGRWRVFGGSPHQFLNQCEEAIPVV